MRRVVWILYAVVFLLLAAFVHWSLPAHYVVRVLGTDVVRLQVADTDERGERVSRVKDVRYINAISAEGRPRVFRNEDTGWGWPPYFKHDTADLAARAQDAVSSEADPRWMVITAYGWRIHWLSRFPNAVSIRRAEAADETIVPWVSIVVWTLFVVFAAYVGLRLRRFFAARDARAAAAG